MERKVEVIIYLKQVIRIDGVEHVVSDDTSVKDRSAEIETQAGHGLFPGGDQDIVDYLGYHYLGQPRPESWGEPDPKVEAMIDVMRTGRGRWWW